MKARFALPVIAMLAAFAGQAAGATSFTVIATVSGTGGATIGAISGNTLYGTILEGGARIGTLFKLTTAGVYTQLHDFVAATDGTYPAARLALGPDGSVWGVAQLGGAYSGGTLFSYGSSGFQVKHAFGNGDDGVHPMQGPVADGTGAFVDTLAGGAYDTNGDVFKYETTGKYGSMHNFKSLTDGHCPFSGPTVTPSGLIYGTTVGMGYGGNPNGSIWKYDGKLHTVYSFTDGTDGEWPDQAPVGDAQGNVYGTTYIQHGKGFAGAIWKLTPSGVFSVLHSLDGATDGYQPNSPLILNKDGYLWGTTASGGAKNLGTVFRISTSGMFALMHSFTGGADGGNPTGSLVHDAAGAIYGGTVSGTVFKITD